MENKTKKTFLIDLPKDGDEVGIGLTHKQAWLETYLSPENGITKDVINNLVGFVVGEGGDAYRRNVFNESRITPEKILYRVVKNNNGKVVGFMHCSKEETHNELGAIYLLNEAKGFGVGGELMEEFLDWADKRKPCQLEVFALNEKALGFYNKYGFLKTDKPAEKFKGKLDVITMARPAECKD